MPTYNHLPTCALILPLERSEPIPQRLADGIVAALEPQAAKGGASVPVAYFSRHLSVFRDYRYDGR
jgi:hypothetical protein